MDGFHDDTITCLAMGLFVVQFSMKKELRNKAMDESILKAMIQANSRVITTSDEMLQTLRGLKR
jgi:hypothetical protein